MRATSFLSTIAFTFTSLSVAVPSISGFTLQWSDDFNGNAGTLPSSSNWIIDTGTSYNSACPSQWGTGEIETYTKSTSNVALDGNGHLAITPLKSSSGAWTSARIETVRTDFAAPANGRMIMQASISLPNLPASQSQGLWPAFWALGSGYRGQCQGWPGMFPGARLLSYTEDLYSSGRVRHHGECQRAQPGIWYIALWCLSWRCVQRRYWAGLYHRLSRKCMSRKLPHLYHRTRSSC
jgi:hypothetical protein